MLVHRLLFGAKYAYLTSKKPHKTEKCSKCGKIIAEPKELIRISAR